MNEAAIVDTDRNHENLEAVEEDGGDGGDGPYYSSPAYCPYSHSQELVVAGDRETYHPFDCIHRSRNNRGSVGVVWSGFLASRPSFCPSLGTRGGIESLDGLSQDLRTKRSRNIAIVWSFCLRRLWPI